MKAMKMGIVAAAAVGALALVPSGASAATEHGICDQFGLPNETIVVPLGPVGQVTLRTCMQSRRIDCDETGQRILRLPANPIIRLQINRCDS